MHSKADLEEAIVHGAVKRIRPKMMTVTAMFVGLLPIMWSVGAGADVMKRIAAPMVGGGVQLLPARAARLPGAVLPVEMAPRDAARSGSSAAARSIRRRAHGSFTH
jgi:Cu/Ag efflux pump CusA